MWEIEPEDFCYLEAENFFFPHHYHPYLSLTSQSPNPTPPTPKPHPAPSKRTTQIHARKIKRLQRRIKELETELKLIKQCRKQESCRCLGDQTEEAFQNEGPCQDRNSEFICQMETPCPQHLEFEKFKLVESVMDSPSKQTESNGQSWILTGMMMLVMGININGYDETALDVYKLARESISEVRCQIENCLDEITLPIFYSKIFSDVAEESGAAHPAGANGLEIQGIRLNVVDQDALMFQEHIGYKLKYEALNAMAEFMKEYVLLY